MCDCNSLKLCLEVPSLMSSFCVDCCETECPCIALCCFCPCYFYGDNKKSKPENKEEHPPKYTDCEVMEKK